MEFLTTSLHHDCISLKRINVDLTRDGERLAFAVVHRLGGKRMVLSYIYSKESGLGNMLLNKIIELMDLRSITLELSPLDDKLVKYYHKYGFKRTDLLTMVREPKPIYI